MKLGAEGEAYFCEEINAEDLRSVDSEVDSPMKLPEDFNDISARSEKPESIENIATVKARGFKSENP